MSKITDIKAREVLDSRGDPTIEVDVILGDKSFGRAIVPSGASTGIREALALRDGDKKRYHGMGVLKAIESVESIKKEIIGLDVTSYQKIDQLMIEMDGTTNKSNLGANSILGISMAVSKAAANFENVPLYKFLSKSDSFNMPVPLMNVINGGAHADNRIDIQEFMICPINFDSIRDAIRAGSEIFRSLKEILQERLYSTNVGDEGGFAPNLKGTEEALDLILMAIERAGYKPGEDIYLALDVAASELYKGDHYKFKKEKIKFELDEMIEFYDNLVGKYPIFSIEDPLGENDFSGWTKLTEKIGHKVQLVGDDVFVTNPKIFKEGIDLGIANSILIKPNQVGTLLETSQTIDLARQNGYKTIISHRSGETEDTIIAHLAVGYNAMQIKTGSLSRTDRLAKYNELIRIEESCNSASKYPGKDIFYK